MSVDQHAMLAISSMATRQILADLLAAYRERAGCRVSVLSVGGVDAAKRVRSGEYFDLVFLADDAMTALQAEGLLAEGTRRVLMRSTVVAAVPKGALAPDVGSEMSLRSAVLAAPSIAYSTGPSGTALLALFASWGVMERVQARLVLAPPGVAVGQLLADGRAALGFQQHAELLNLDGVTILGPLPAPVQIETLFSGAVSRACRDPRRMEEATSILQFMASAAAHETVRAYGMSPI